MASAPSSLLSGVAATPMSAAVAIAACAVAVLVLVLARSRDSGFGIGGGTLPRQKVGSVVGTVVDLFVYPVKSCAGTRLHAAQISETGFRFDRRFMLTVRGEEEKGDDDDNEKEHVGEQHEAGAAARAGRGGSLTMVSQRQFPRMALVQPTVQVEQGRLVGLRLALAEGSPALSGDAPAPEPLVIDLRRWTRSASAHDNGDDGGDDDDDAAADADGQRRAAGDVVIWPTDRREENARGAVILGRCAAEWFRAALGTDAPLELVFMDERCRREVGGKFSARTGAARPCRNSFADVTHYLVVSRASVAELNRRIAAAAADAVAGRGRRRRRRQMLKGDNAGCDRGGGDDDAADVGVDRFRPNIVVDGTVGPHAEDQWATVEFVPHQGAKGDGNGRGGDSTTASPEHGEATRVVMYGVKNCTRCVIPTTNQRTAVQGGIHAEPLATLREYRKDPAQDNKVVFGEQFCHNAWESGSEAAVGPEGRPDLQRIHVGDAVRLLKWKPGLPQTERRWWQC